jgi:hypothetical protein
LEKRKLGPDVGKCVCERELQDAFSCAYSSNSQKRVLHRCMCGFEWTARFSAINPADPISSDGVIEVHVRLAKFEGSFSELLNQLSLGREGTG